MRYVKKKAKGHFWDWESYIFRSMPNKTFVAQVKLYKSQESSSIMVEQLHRPWGCPVLLAQQYQIA